MAILTGERESFLSEGAQSPSPVLTRALISLVSMLNFSSCWDGLAASFPLNDCLWKRPAGGLGRICEVATFRFGAAPGTKLDRMILRLAGGGDTGTFPPEFKSGVGRREGRMLMFWFLGG